MAARVIELQSETKTPSLDDAADTTAIADEITELCGYLNAGTFRLLTLIREFDEARGWEAPGLYSCAHWLNFKCGIGMNAAREKVRVAHVLRDLPKISAAFERGEVSYSKVRAMTRIATADNEDYLLQIAHYGTAHHVEKLVRITRRVQRVREAQQANALHAQRYLAHHYDEDGCLVITARLPAEQGVLVVKALERALDRQFRDSDPAVHDVTAETSTVESQQASIGTRRADAIAEMAESYLASDGNTGSAGDRYQVVLHVTAETRGSAAETEAYLEDGPHVAAETSRRIACDCSVVPFVEDPGGKPLSVGRKTRSIPPAIRRALKIRDGGCRFPGCTNERFVDGHHINHWANGGETSLENLVLLCRHHHRLVHEGGYGCNRTKDGEILFTAPECTPLPDFYRSPPVDGDPRQWLLYEFEKFEIDDNTCTGDVTDLSIDWDLALAPLVPGCYFEFRSASRAEAAGHPV